MKCSTINTLSSIEMNIHRLPIHSGFRMDVAYFRFGCMKTNTKYVFRATTGRLSGTVMSRIGFYGLGLTI